MGLFSFLFNKNNDIKPEKQTQNKFENVEVRQGNIETNYIRISPANINDIKSSYIAIDLETTGLSATNDKIIEIGAVKFENCMKVGSYNTLIRIGSHIPEAATKVNHITDDMLNEHGIDPEIAYKEFVEFIGNTINGDNYIVAHNARFDLGFLKNTLELYGYDGVLNYVDTLYLSKSILKDLNNHKQGTVAKHFGIINDEEHRAEADAQTCGLILSNILNILEDNYKKIAEKSALTSEEKEVAAVILQSLLINGYDISKIGFYRNSSGYVDVTQIYTIFKFKLGKNGSYIITDKNTAASCNVNIGDCTKTEGIDNCRVFFNNRQELENLSSIILDIYNCFTKNSLNHSYTNRYEAEFLSNASFTFISENDIPDLINDYDQRDLEKANLLKAKEEAKIKASEQKAAAKLKKQLSEEDKIKKAEERKKKEESQKLMYQNLLEKSEHYTDDQIRKIIEISAGTGKRSVIQMDDDSNIIKIYMSVADASKEVNIAPKTIRDVANGKYKHAAGFCWMYTDQYFN